MANTSLTQFITTLDGVLDYDDGTGSVNLYMAHGGTNFGYSAGAQAGPARVLTCRSCHRICKLTALLAQLKAVQQSSQCWGLRELGATCICRRDCINTKAVVTSCAVSMMARVVHAGGSIDNGVYWACITSYDYDAPISESGDYGQPGIGGPNKFDVRHSPCEFTACGQNLKHVPYFAFALDLINTFPV